MNPAIALGIFFGSWLTGDIGEALEYIWLYPVFPFMGSVLAVFFFEFVFKKTQVMLNNLEAADTEVNELEQALEQEIDVK